MRWRIIGTRAMQTAGMLLAGSLLAPAGAQQESAHGIRLIVLDSSGRTGGAPLFIAHSANGWNPGDLDFVLERMGEDPETDAPKWTIELPRRLLERAPLEYKITRGTWRTVEVDAAGRDIANRVLALPDDDDGAFEVVIEVQGFRDLLNEKGGRAASTVTGNLDVFDFTSRIRTGSRKIRVWTPPGYHSLELADKRYPVLYMHDGQNLFDEATSFIGVEWRVDETLTRLITAGDVPPMIVVGIDNAGSDRADEYSPLPLGRRRPDLGGEADSYLRMLREEIMPLINERYRSRTGPANTAMGGSSLGGLVTLYAAMHMPGQFGALLVESPALGVGDGAFMDMLEKQERWPARIFMAGGTKEAVFEDGRSRYPELIRRAERALRARGLDENRLKVVIEEGAEHNEAAWAARLPEALRFLFGS